MTAALKLTPNVPTSDTLEKLLGARAVCELLSVNDRTLRRWLSCGRFPAPLRLPGRRLRWRESVIRDFLTGLEGEK